jgi:hypothetical protein
VYKHPKHFWKNLVFAKSFAKRNFAKFQNHPGNKNFLRNEISRIFAEKNKFSPNFAFCENEKGVFVSTLDGRLQICL